MEESVSFILGHPYPLKEGMSVLAANWPPKNKTGAIASLEHQPKPLHSFST